MHRTIKMLIALVLFFVPAQYSKAQTPIRTGHEGIMNNDSARCRRLYDSGYLYEQQGKHDKSIKKYKNAITLSDSINIYKPFYYDCLLKVMLWDIGHGLHEEAITYGLASMKTPTSCQEAYHYQYKIYITLAHALNMAGKYAEVPIVAKKGMNYAKMQLDPTKDEYFQLSYAETVAWSLMGNIAKADSTYRWIDVNAKKKSKALKKAMGLLHDNIKVLRVNGVAEQKQKTFNDIDELRKRIALANPQTSQGSDIIHNYFNYIRQTLSLYYFDTGSINDERLWNKCIADMMLTYYIMCDNLPNREAEGYDNIITRKDFLAYHTGKFRKRALSWKDIQNMLNDGEAAIELTCLPEEFLVIRKGYHTPKSIVVDSLTFKAIETEIADEPNAIANLYTPGGPLTRLWNMIEPTLKDVKTIYISGSNTFNLINFSAIPLSDGRHVADIYDIHQLLTTTDIAETRVKANNYHDAVIFGDIDYEPEGHADSIRGGFHKLPYSAIEVNMIDSIMRSLQVPHKMFTGKIARESDFKLLNGHAPRLLHVSTHGFMNAPLSTSFDSAAVDTAHTLYNGILSQSGLLFAGANKAWNNLKERESNEGILTSREMANMDLSRCNLIVLSACRSALGENRNLTGVPFGVAYALKMAGVKQVVCSLWSISDKATALFMGSFYQHLLTTQDATKSIRLARQDMINKGYTSPYYWASFVLIE